MYVYIEMPMYLIDASVPCDLGLVKFITYILVLKINVWNTLCNSLNATQLITNSNRIYEYNNYLKCFKSSC